jgi:ABC-type oligopeptide transport system substrate-binding subunit
MRLNLLLAFFLLQCSTQTIAPPKNQKTLSVSSPTVPTKTTTPAKEKKYAFQKPRQNKGQTLYFNNAEVPQTIDPGLATGTPDGRIIDALFDGLMEYDPKTLAPIPALAESYEESPNKDHYIFHLRKDAKWSNGDPSPHTTLSTHGSGS